jgi:hypothetical protein
MSVAVFSEHLGNWGPHRARDLYNEGTIDAVYAKVWPLDAAAKANVAAWAEWRTIYPGPLWGWMVCSADQIADAVELVTLNAELLPDGWLLNIEKPLEGAELRTIIRAAEATGKPVRASLAGIDASHVEYDYRALDRAGIEIDWQAYADSGEGPDPATAVRELYECSFVVPGWEYRSRIGMTYGWGKVTKVSAANLPRLPTAYYDAYKFSGPSEYEFEVALREGGWGWTVTDRKFRFVNSRLLGRARYSKIRVTLDVTRGANDKHTPAEWTAIAASARMPGLAKRPVSVYLAEVASDEVLRAIAAGAR